MIQGHALDVLLAPSYRVGAVFNIWLFLRGITAPMFLTLAGFAFAIVTTRRWDAYLHNTPEMRRRIFRFCSLIFLGYLMHMPVRSPLDIPSMDASAWQSWLQVDALQCIGLTLLVLQLSILITRTPQRFAALAGGLAVLILGSAHFVWNSPWVGRLPAFFAAYCNGRSGSLFPLFPWSAYVCTGVWLGVWYLRRPAEAASRLLTVGGTLIIAAGVFLEKPVMAFCGDAYFWKTSPHLFILRIGIVSVLLSIVERLSRLAWVPRSLTQALAQQSLFLYLVHLSILYGSAWNTGLRQWYGATLDPLHTFLWIGVLLVLMMLLAWGTSQIKWKCIWNLPESKAPSPAQRVWIGQFPRSVENEAD
jgi:uncharacterized membrane protein